MRLLQLDNEGIVKLLEDHDNNVKALKKDLLTICWFMRGGVSYTEAMIMGHEERQIISGIIDSNLEITKESKMLFF